MQHSDLQTISKIPDVPSRGGLSRSLHRIAGLTQPCSVKTTCVVLRTNHANGKKITIHLSLQCYSTLYKWKNKLCFEVLRWRWHAFQMCVRSDFKLWSSFGFTALLIVSPRSLKGFWRRIIFKTFMTARETLNSCQIPVLSLFKENLSDLFLASSSFVYCHAWAFKKLWADRIITGKNNLH